MMFVYVCVEFAPKHLPKLLTTPVDKFFEVALLNGAVSLQLNGCGICPRLVLPGFKLHVSTASV